MATKTKLETHYPKVSHKWKAICNQYLLIEHGKEYLTRSGMRKLEDLVAQTIHNAEIEAIKSPQNAEAYIDKWMKNTEDVLTTILVAADGFHELKEAINKKVVAEYSAEYHGTKL